MGIYQEAILSFSIQIGPKALARFHELKRYSDQDWIHPLGADNWLLHLPNHGTVWLWPPIECRYGDCVLQQDFVELKQEFWKIDPFLLEEMKQIIQLISPAEIIEPVEPRWWYMELPMWSTLGLTLGLTPDNQPQQEQRPYVIKKWRVVPGSPFGKRPGGSAS